MGLESWLLRLDGARLWSAILHSLWQSALIALIATLLGRALARSMKANYAVHVLAMCLTIVGFAITYAIDDVAIAMPSVPPELLTPSTPAALIFAVGVVLMLLRSIKGLIGFHSTVTTSDCITTGAPVALLEELTPLWSLRAVPALVVTRDVQSPTVRGLLRPVILAPPSAIAELSPYELQCVFGVLLSLVRQYGLWIIVVRRLAETILFYNPACWYLSRRTENVAMICADDLTIQVLLSAGRIRSRTELGLVLLRLAAICDADSAALSGREITG